MNEIRDVTSNKSAKYSRWSEIRKFGQKFEDDPKIKRNGKYVSLKDFTNENAVDSNIYEVLAKYRGDLKLTQAQMNTYVNAIADDISSIKSMAEALEIEKKAKETWANLPMEIRKEFGNNKTQFLINGAQWANKKINEYKAKEAELKAKQEQAMKESEVING